LKTAELCAEAVKRENQMKRNNPMPEGFEEVNKLPSREGLFAMKFTGWDYPLI